MTSRIIKHFIVFVLLILGISNSNANTDNTVSGTVQNSMEAAQTTAFNAELRVISSKSLIKAQLSAYSKSYFDLANIYVLQFQLGNNNLKLTSLKAVELSSKSGASRTLFTFTKPKNYLIFYSYDADAKQAYEMRIPTDSLKTGQFADFPVLDKKTGKLSTVHITLLKIQHK